MKIDEILEQIDKQGGPSPITDEERLHRVRLQIHALCSKIIEAAEEKYPGIEAMQVRLIEQEEQLAKKVGQA